MITRFEVQETNQMIEQAKLDVRTITLGINLLDCADSNMDTLNRKIYDKITKTAEHLVKVGEDIEKEFGIPIVNKRISVTPISIVAAATNAQSYVPVAHTWTGLQKQWGLILLEVFQP